MNLPAHWVKVKIKEVVVHSIGGVWGESPNTPTSLYHSICKVVKATDFKNWAEHNATNATLRKIKNTDLTTRRLQEGDIIIEISGGGPTQPVGRTILINENTINSNKEILVFSNFFRLMRFASVLYPPFVQYYLTYQYRIGELDKYQKNTNNLRNFQFENFLENFEIPIPSIEEQKQIVLELSKQLKEHENDLENAKKEIERMKQYKESVINDAITGKLTREWRESNPSNYTPLNHANTDTSIYPNVILPENWYFAKIEEIATLQQGMQIEKNDRYGVSSNNRLPLLKIKNFTNNFTDDVEYVELKQNTLIAEEKDVIVARTGTVGKILTGVKGVFHNNTFRINFDTSIVLREYLILVLESLFVQNFIKKHTRHSSHADLSHTVFKICTIPLTSLEEQLEIATNVNFLLSQIESEENDYKKRITKVYALQQSVLQMAFAGQLTVSSINKPIANLLETIKKEKNETQAKFKLLQQSNLKINAEMRKKIAQQPALGLKEVMEKDAAIALAKDVWLASMYKDSIDDFYTAASHESKNGGISWHLEKKDTSTPESIILLNL